MACLRSHLSRSPGLMHLLRCLVFVEAQYNCFLLPTYIETRVADDLSRDRVFSFLSKVPGADPRPSPVPHRLLDLLLDIQADWISPAWRRQFGGTSMQAGLAPTTQKSYQAAMRRFEDFCTHFNVTTPFPLRAPNVLLCIRFSGGTTDYKILSFGTPQHATVIRVSRPEGAVVVAVVKTDSSWHCPVQAPEGPIQPQPSPYHGSHSPQDRTGLVGGTLSGEGSPLGGSLAAQPSLASSG